MDLELLSISRFRNFGLAREIELPRQGLLVAAAPNATGKTNFLESVMVLLRGKSWRAKVGDCVAWGQDDFVVRGNLVRADEKKTVAVRYHKPTRKLRIEENGVPTSIVGFYARYPLVVFLPEDTFMFSRGPERRRNFLNQVLVAHQFYVSSLVQYHRVLRQRNSLLKRATSVSEVETWTELLVDHAEALWNHRQSLATFLDDKLSDMHERLTGERLNLRVILRAGVKNMDGFKRSLEENFDQERRFGYTFAGPHRDDLEITSDDHPVGIALSRGQVRGLALALKLLAHRYIKKATGEAPILLLDDILSEMDQVRQQTLLNNLPATQTLLTCTAVPPILQQRSEAYLLDLQSIIDKSGHERRRNGEGRRHEQAQVLPVTEPETESVKIATS